MFRVARKIKEGSYFEPNNSTRRYIKFNRDIRRAGTISALVLILLFLWAAFPIINKAMEVEAIAGAAKASDTTLTMTSGSESASLNLTPAGSPNGVFASSSSSQTAKFGVVTNNHTGYTLSISALNNNGELTNSEANAVLNSITNPTDADVFNTSTALNGKWGYQPSKYNSAANTNFLPAPTTNATTLDVTGSANNELNNYTIGLGARVDHTKPAGSYTNTFILTAIGNPVTYSITYADSTGDTTVANLPTFGSDPTNHTQTGSISATSINLSSTIPTRTNYNFKSWCLGTVSNNSTTCTGTEYNAGASFNIDQTTANTSTLYAVWNPNITIKTNTGISKVTLNGTECTSTSGCTVTGLVYGQQYSLVATVSTGYSFTSWNAGSYGSVAANTASTTYTVGGGASTITPTAVLDKYTCIKQYRLQGSDGSWGSYTTESTEQVSGTCSYSKTLSGYKGSDTGANGSAATTSGISANGEDVTLQVSMYRNTYTVSLTKGTGINSVSVTGTGVKSGSGAASATVYHGGTVTIAATLLSNEYYWVNWTGSSTYTNQSSSVYVTSDRSFVANGIKCTNNTVSGYMQNFTVPTYPCNTSGTLTDSRDNQNYTVAVINGKWWMTRNLAIGCNGSGSSYGSGRTTRSLTSSNSNVSSTWSTGNAGNLVDDTNASRTTANMQCNATYGAFYNYIAATAGTIYGDKNTTEASSSICPSGWRLPAKTEQTGIKSYMAAFNPVAGGAYSIGYLSFTNTGRWWSSTAQSNGVYRYYLGYYGTYMDTAGYTLDQGIYVRCIKA